MLRALLAAAMTASVVAAATPRDAARFIGEVGPSLEWPELLPYNPVAPSSIIVDTGKARFTVLASRVIRIEYSENGQFGEPSPMCPTSFLCAF